MTDKEMTLEERIADIHRLCDLIQADLNELKIINADIREITRNIKSEL